MVGFMLSPLSWWNDMVVNLPLAVAFGWVVSLFQPAWYNAAVVVGYWLTNVLGFVLMHRAAAKLLSDSPRPPYGWRPLCRDMLVSLLYTGLIVLLIKLRVLAPFSHAHG